MVLAGPAVVMSSDLLDNYERIGALLHNPKCSALVIGVGELSQHKRSTACRLGRTVNSLPMHRVSGTGIVMSSGVPDNSEGHGALLRHPECSALVIGVVELPQQKRHTACAPDPTLKSPPVDRVSGTGGSHVEWCA